VTTVCDLLFSLLYVLRTFVPNMPNRHGTYGVLRSLLWHNITIHVLLQLIMLGNSRAKILIPFFFVIVIIYVSSVYLWHPLRYLPSISNFIPSSSNSDEPSADGILSGGVSSGLTGGIPNDVAPAGDVTDAIAGGATNGASIGSFIGEEINDASSLTDTTLLSSSKEALIQSFLNNPIDGPHNLEPLMDLCSKVEWTEGLIFRCLPPPGGIGNIRNILLNCIRFVLETGG
jgi:hypothetical protein